MLLTGTEITFFVDLVQLQPLCTTSSEGNLNQQDHSEKIATIQVAAFVCKKWEAEAGRKAW